MLALPSFSWALRGCTTAAKDSCYCVSSPVALTEREGGGEGEKEKDREIEREGEREKEKEKERQRERERESVLGTMSIIAKTPDGKGFLHYLHPCQPEMFNNVRVQCYHQHVQASKCVCERVLTSSPAFISFHSLVFKLIVRT